MNASVGGLDARGANIRLAGEGRARVTERYGAGSRAARVIIFAIELCT